MTSATLRTLCRDLGSRTAVADLFGVDTHEVGLWIDGVSAPSAAQTRRIRSLLEVFAAVRVLDRPETARRWLVEPSPSLEGATPLDVAMVDGAKRVLDALADELGG